MLSSARYRHHKIIDIAYACGFGDISYFNHRFRRCYGVPPSGFRTSGGADD
jgi:AraC-like DNA-binding protein